MSAQRPYIVGLGGTTNAHSSTEQYLQIALRAAAAAGASTRLLGAEALQVPMYQYGAVCNGAALPGSYRQRRRKSACGANRVGDRVAGESRP